MVTNHQTSWSVVCVLGTDRWTDRLPDRWTDEWPDEWPDEWTDKSCIIKQDKKTIIQNKFQNTLTTVEGLNGPQPLPVHWPNYTTENSTT
jgi:hypothetical protein